MWIGGCVCGAAARAGIFMVRDYDPAKNVRTTYMIGCCVNVMRLFLTSTGYVFSLAFHSFGLYIHNDTMRALGHPQDQFLLTPPIQLKPVFANWIPRHSYCCCWYNCSLFKL
jgi:photosystem I P700 chlorophyll a apoprotein A1